MCLRLGVLNRPLAVQDEVNSSHSTGIYGDKNNKIPKGLLRRCGETYKPCIKAFQVLFFNCLLNVAFDAMPFTSPEIYHYDPPLKFCTSPYLENCIWPS